MSTLHRFLRSDAAGSYNPPRLAAPNMNYIELINRFWAMDAEDHFGASSTRLYFFLVQVCNQKRWENPFTLSDAQLCLSLDMTANTMKKAREELTERKLVAYQGGNNGRGLATVYRLLSAPNKVSKNDTYGTDKSIGKVSGKVSENDGLSPIKVSDKVSKNDTPYIDKTVNSSVVENINEEVASEASSSAARSERKVTPQPASQKPTLGTEGGAAQRPESQHADAQQLTTADVCPLLNNPAVFKAACLDINPDYAGIDFNHYRLEMRFDALEQQLTLMPFEWRKRLRNWLTNAKGSRNGLILAPAPGQKADPRAQQPLASKSSASPSKVKDFS
ncbi:hypothetical protein HER32_11865 [Hymenobacter sp. BT18]|uniref:hypothetical protein n=1 Tax=Hymenobacter sp. BT18 TaxID=2835648 RepID=UPI00143E4689|nr:hypothetical protein [Hymenobacter sp. BT18]QIX61838.1 hypothetical protein HER32_11865 [Hymenobacter sp. BT18]